MKRMAVITSEVADLLSTIRESNGVDYAAKKKVAALFGKALGLGGAVPGKALHDMSPVPCKPMLCDTLTAHKIVTGHAWFTPPYHDHTWNYYEKLPVGNSHVLYCSAVVDMPYLGAIQQNHLECIKYASAVGWVAERYTEWSWYNPGQSDLVLYRPKTPFAEVRAAWATSFKRLVWENEPAITMLDLGPIGSDLRLALRDIMFDDSYPLTPVDVASAENETYGNYFFNGAALLDAHAEIVNRICTLAADGVIK